MNHHTITIDIETIGTQRDDVRDYLSTKICKETQDKLTSIKAPANYKDEAKITEYIANATKALIDGEQAAIDEAVSRTGLDGSFGQVVVIGFDLHDTGEPDVIYDLDEYVVLTRFNAALDAIPRNLWSATTLVGHNITSFDLRFLIQRYIVNGIRPHAILSTAASAKPWDGRVYDTMTAWNPDRQNRTSLDKLCMALSIPSPKGDMDGSMVGQAVADGRIAEVAAYCKKDVAATREVYRRMTFADADQMQ